MTFPLSRSILDLHSVFRDAYHAVPTVAIKFENGGEVTVPTTTQGRALRAKETPMTVTVLYPEDRQIPDLALEKEIFGPEVRLIRATKSSFAELGPIDCAAADGLMIGRWAVTAADLERFPLLRCVVRMGVGYDKLDRKALAERTLARGKKLAPTC
jgi:hypothetical protein